MQPWRRSYGQSKPRHGSYWSTLFWKFEFKDFQAHFNAKKHFIKASYTFLIPREFLFTAKGLVSKRSMDLDNCIKLVQDNVCDAKYNGRIIGDVTINNLNIDDKFICSFDAAKVLSFKSDYYINIKYELVDIKPLKKVYRLDNKTS